MPAYLPPQAYFPPRAVRKPRAGWLRRNSWVLLTLPFGLTTWAAFLYIGIRDRRRQWVVWAAVYGAMELGFLVLADSDTGANLALALGLLAWIGGAAHGFAITGSKPRRTDDPGDTAVMRDPALIRAKIRIERRAEGRKLLAADPLLAREAGLGRPDLPGADDYGLVDVNHAGEAALRMLPGITDEVVQKIISTRAEVGGFTSAEDLGVALDLPPMMVEAMRDVAVFPR